PRAAGSRGSPAGAASSQEAQKGRGRGGQYDHDQKRRAKNHRDDRDRQRGRAHVEHEVLTGGEGLRRDKGREQGDRDERHSALNAAGGAASRPRTLGFESAWVARAPMSVPVFRKTKSTTPVAQNAKRPESGSSRAMAIAVVSSITNCEASARRQPRTARSVESLRP